MAQSIYPFVIGVKTDNTAPFSPQMNSKAERLNRTLCEKMRALLFDSGLEKEMWGEALRVSCYVTNRSPSVACDVTPIQLWTKVRPDLSKLKLFGCDAFAKNLRYTKKLDERSEKLKFVGYAHNGFRLWDSVKRKVITSRDVKFGDVSRDIRKNESVVQLELESEDDVDDRDDVDVSPAQPQVDDSTGGESDDEDAGAEQLDEPYQLRPRGQIRPPEVYDDYHMNLTEVSLGQSSVMLSFSDAVSCDEKNKWLKAINEEKRSLSLNQTWKYVPVKEASGRKILSSKWVFKVKENGVYKARLVVRGFQQESGVDYQETYSPVVNMTSLRVLLAVTAAKNFVVKTFDVKTAFLNGQLDEDVFMHIPEGFEKKNGMICKLTEFVWSQASATYVESNVEKVT